MNEFTSKSKIDYFRKRRHGEQSRFRFLRDTENGYLKTAELASHFLVNRQFDVNIGARVEKLVFDKPAAFSMSALEGAEFGDLVNDDGTFKRYRITADAEPTAQENRYRFVLTAAFTDETPIVTP
jgi:hypothetical protein